MTNTAIRIGYQYFLLDFNVGSLEIIGFCSSSFALAIGALLAANKSLIRGEFLTPGEAGVLVLLTIICTQLGIGFLYFNATQQPLKRMLKNIMLSRGR